MMTEELTTCPKCGYEKALTHWSNGNDVNWIACPKCHRFFDHDIEEKEYNDLFWACVKKDTEYRE